jgi:hypothetical protein
MTVQIDFDRFREAVALVLEHADDRERVERYLAAGANILAKRRDDDIDIALGFGREQEDLARLRADAWGTELPDGPTDDERAEMIQIGSFPYSVVTQRPQG